MSRQRVKSSSDEKFAVEKRCRREAARHDLDTHDEASRDSCRLCCFRRLRLLTRGEARLRVLLAVNGHIDK